MFVLVTFLENPLTSFNTLLIEVKFNDQAQSQAFKRHSSVKDLDCTAFFDGNNKAIQGYIKNRVKLEDPKDWKDLPMDCEAIKSRHYFQTDDLYEDERDFPIAFARAVFTDYYFLEMELASTYAPQNVYCYAIDSKSSSLFHSRMQSLSNCFPNVFLTKREFEMDSMGKNMGYSHLECMREIAAFNWRYLILLQNHDITLKTNQELIQIFKWYNGTNDVSSLNVIFSRPTLSNGIWSFGELNLIKNATDEQKKAGLQFAKSLVQVSVSRQMIDFILNKLDLTILLDKIHSNVDSINGIGLSHDELLIGTLNSEDKLKIPGGFTQHCLKIGYDVHSLTRLSYWRNLKPCISKIKRHAMCIFAVEHLAELSKDPHLFANKFMPDKDFGAISCWLEHIHNRTHLKRGIERLDPQTYLNMPQVRFNRERSQLGSHFNLSNFKCN